MIEDEQGEWSFAFGPVDDGFQSNRLAVLSEPGIEHQERDIARYSIAAAGRLASEAARSIFDILVRARLFPRCQVPVSVSPASSL